MQLTAKQTKLVAPLLPFLQGEGPKENGEWDMRCPLHLDNNRSASINIEKEVWICYMGCGSGTIRGLIHRQAEWVSPARSAGGGSAKSGMTQESGTAPTRAKVLGWASALMANESRLKEFQRARSLDRSILEQHSIGWDSSSSAYTIPIFGVDGEIQNVRYYQLNPPAGRRKMWSVSGLGKPRLYPCRVLDDNPDKIIVCEGELDALACIQRGIPAITRTASATTWDLSWNPLFKGKRIYLIHDADTAGQMANLKLERALRGVAESVVPVRLPYKVQPKHGKDLTDFFKDGYSADDLRELMDMADAKHAPDRPVVLDPTDASILETLDSLRVGQPQRITATVRAKLEPGYSIPRAVDITCTMDRGESVCGVCPLFGAGGKARVEIAPNDPDVLGLIDATKQQVTEIVRDKFGAVRCPRIQATPVEYQAVEQLFVRPSVDHVQQRNQSADSQSRKITSVGKHDTRANTTVEIVGALYPDPRRQRNEFLAWSVEETETTIDSFVLTSELAKQLEIFKPRRGQGPLAKRVEVAKELSREVTKIYGRDEMHVAMDMVWHSALAFQFDGAPVDRGWVELLVVGDTRTGKSEAAERLTEHYRAGEIVSCESASYAGIIGGLQQFGGSGEWSISWGVVPMADRRQVTLDEVSGLSTEEIGKMSSVRSSGRAEVKKIRQDETSARTRLIWLGNPRNGGMDKYLYGVDAIPPLIGNPEDIARFTIAMCVRAGEVPLEVINSSRPSGKLHYTSELCNALIMWCWSRKREHIKFTQRAIDTVYKEATRMGLRYTESPPLIQAANVRVKIASLAVALAGATFSTDEGLENVIVDRTHVIDAVKFVDHIYAMQSFGYLERSQEAHRDHDQARSSTNQARQMLKTNPELRKFLRMQTKFKRQDVEEVLALSREAANGIINQLHEMRMIKKQSGFVVVSPVLHDILRTEKHANG